MWFHKICKIIQYYDVLIFFYVLFLYAWGHYNFLMAACGAASPYLFEACWKCWCRYIKKNKKNETQSLECITRGCLDCLPYICQKIGWDAWKKNSEYDKIKVHWILVLTEALWMSCICHFFPFMLKMLIHHEIKMKPKFLNILEAVSIVFRYLGIPSMFYLIFQIL